MSWEFDIEARMSITLVMGGPTSEDAARLIMAKILAGDIKLYHFIKWDFRPFGGLPVPVQRIIDNDPRIVAVREVSDD
jgi:hypothetical protein